MRGDESRAKQASRFQDYLPPQSHFSIRGPDITNAFVDKNLVSKVVLLGQYLCLKGISRIFYLAQLQVGVSRRPRSLIQHLLGSLSEGIS
jgi:hypothetical protein